MRILLNTKSEEVMAQRNVLLSARPSTRNVFITIMQVLVLFTISITAAGDVRSMRRMSAGMFIFPGACSLLFC